MSLQHQHPYQAAFRGAFKSALRWPQLDQLWKTIKAAPDGWYIYALGDAPPEEVSTADELVHFIDRIDELLRREHDEEYCGIVYSDRPDAPSMVKIFDPNNLGVSCGYSDNPPLPGWVLSRLEPVDMGSDQIVPKNRRRWWQQLFIN